MFNRVITRYWKFDIIYMPIVFIIISTLSYKLVPSPWNILTIAFALFLIIQNFVLLYFGLKNAPKKEEEKEENVEFSEEESKIDLFENIGKF